MLQVCRICLLFIITDEEFFEIENDATHLSAASNRHKIKSVIPEMNLKLCKNSVICKSCHDGLEASFQFKSKYSKTEGIIANYLSAKRIPQGDFDLKHVALVNNGLLVGENSKYIEEEEGEEIHADEEIIEISDDEIEDQEGKNKAVLKLRLKVSDNVCSKRPRDPPGREKQKSNEEIEENTVNTLPRIVKVVSLKNTDPTRSDKHLQYDFQCKMCPRKFTTENRLRSHMASYCFSRFRVVNRNTDLSNGEGFNVTVSKIGAVPADPSRFGNSYACRHCARKFSSKKGLSNHTSRYCKKKLTPNKSNKKIKNSVNSGKNVYSCVKCDQLTFANYNSYKWHMKYIHRTDPYCCGSCGWRFMSKRGLGEHLCHGGESSKDSKSIVYYARRFQCRLCVGCFLDYEGFKRHVEIGHGMSGLCESCFNVITSNEHSCDFLCSVCEESFKDKKDLENHEHY